MSVLVSKQRASSQQRRMLKALVYHAFVILFGTFMIYPLLWLVASSFKDISESWVGSTRFCHWWSHGSLGKRSSSSCCSKNIWSKASAQLA
jgi:ABC-type glycerol-3-phosphate transport system permease component